MDASHGNHDRALRARPVVIYRRRRVALPIVTERRRDELKLLDQFRDQIRCITFTLFH